MKYTLEKRELRAFTVPGEPVPKARPRVSKNTKRAYTPKKTVAYEQRVRESYYNAYPDEKPFPAGTMVAAFIIAYYPVPKSATKKQRADMLAGRIFKTTRPDGDNIEKAIFDALNGMAYDDDGQICYQTCQKRYAEEPRAEIKLYRLVQSGEE